jgi:hypothetical protein
VKVAQVRFALQSIKFHRSIGRITTINRSLFGLATRSEFRPLK